MKKQFIKLEHLRDIYTIKCKLSMLCTSTSKGGIPYYDVHTFSVPWLANGYFSDDYDVPDDEYSRYVRVIDEEYLYNELDSAIEIQEARKKY